MKSFACFTVVLCLAAAALPSRADDTNAISLTIGAADASAHIGKQVTVTGVVAQVSLRPSITFLNFDKPFPKSPFTAIIRNKNTNEFGDLPALKGKPVSVTGKVIDFNGKPEMELTNKAQLKLSGTGK